MKVREGACRCDGWNEDEDEQYHDLHGGQDKNMVVVVTWWR